MDLLSATVMLFLVMDPLGNLPVFLSVLKDVDEKRRKFVLVRELLIAFAILLSFLFAGQYILSFLGLRQESVSIGGGIVLFIIALRMIFPRRGGVMGEHVDGEPFLVPLAIPLVAGPSALATLLLLAHQDPNKMLDWTLALCIAWFASAVILYFSNTFFKLLRQRGLVALERLMGMLLVMLSVQMILDGVFKYLH